MRVLKQSTPAARLLVQMSTVLACAVTSAWAADRTWTGAAGSPWVWTNALNWGGVAPLNNDGLFFAGSSGLSNTNNFPVTNTYSGLTFNSGAGAFVLKGKPISLSNGLTNNSSTLQTVNLNIQGGDLVVRVTNSSTLVLSGSVRSDSGGLIKYGQGTLALYGANTYPGGTTVRKGTILLQTTDGLGASGGGLVLDGGALEVAGSLTLNNRPVTVNAGGGTFNTDPLSALMVTNAIGGSGALTKTGTGTLDLAGPVASTGPLTVNAGTLFVDGLVAGPPTLAVNSGGTLGGSGVIAGNVFIADGGTLSPGTSPGGGPATLTCSNLVISPNAIVRFDLNVPGSLGGTNDLIVVHGDLTLDGILKVTGHGTAGIYPLIRYDGALTDNGMELGDSVAGTLILDPINKLISLNASSFPATAPAPMRIMFVGNSLTFTYDIPGTLQKLADSAGDWFSYNSDLVSGTTLAYHVTDNVTVPLINSGNFDLVMLQEYSFYPSLPSTRDYSMFPAARTLNNNIVAHGEQTMFYETWGYPNGDPADCLYYDTPPQYRGCDSTAMLIATRMAYARIATELNAAISPVGLAWLTVSSQRPDINLYYDNAGNYHPGPAGSYLAACVHYASILGRTPVGNPYTGLVTNAGVAAYLQGVAEQTVFQDPWANDQFGFGPNRPYWAWNWANYTNRSFSRLKGMVISGSGGLPSPSVKLDIVAGQTNTVYLGVYGYNYESAGQGRLYVRPGGSLNLTGDMVVGKEGRGWVQQSGGSLQVNSVLDIAEEPSSSGSYSLAGGALVATQLTVGEQGQGAALQNGGTCQVIGVLRLADQPSSTGTYALSGGALTASRIESGQGTAIFAATGGQFSFTRFGSPTNYFDLDQGGGSLALTNAATVFGDYTLEAPGTLHCVLGSDTNFLLSAAGTVTLAGSLSLSYASEFLPAVGQQFALVNASGVSGRFSKVINPAVLPGGAMLVVSYTATSIVATVASPVPPGLIGWWPGEGDANDLAGNDDGNLLGGATANAPGMVGQAFSLDGTSGCVAIPNTPILRPTNFTIEAWVRFNSLDSAGSGGSPAGDQYLVFKQNTRSTSFEGFDLSKTRVAGRDVFRFLITSATAERAEIESATPLTTGVWYHVAAVRGSNFIRLYVNGNLEGQASASFPQDYGTQPLFFGTSGQSYWDHKLAGLLDEVSLYERALSVDEIAAVYAAGPAGKCREAAVTVEPQDQTAIAGSSVNFAARAFGPVFGYQWLHNGTNILAGATNSTLSLTHLMLSQAGSYSVIGSNLSGVVVSEAVSLEVAPVVGILMPIKLSGNPGSSWRIDYVNNLAPSNNWAPLATVTLTNLSQVYFDTTALTQAHRFYRVVPLP